MPPFNQNQQQLLNDFYNRQKDAMSQYSDMTKAAQANAQSGSNPLAPKMTSTPKGMMSLAGIQGPGGATQPVAGASSSIYGGSTPLQGYMNFFQPQR
jgi:hypothetical protein